MVYKIALTTGIILCIVGVILLVVAVFAEKEMLLVFGNIITFVSLCACISFVVINQHYRLATAQVYAAKETLEEITETLEE